MITTAETFNAAKGLAEETRRSTAEILSKAGADTSAALHSAASTVRQAGNDGAAMLESAGDGAGRRLESASVFVGTYDAGGVLHDMKVIARRHPGPVVLVAATVAAALGYLAGARASGTKG